MKLFDLALIANLQKLFPPSVDAFSIPSSKLCLFPPLIEALLALLASRYSCQASQEIFLLCLLRALLASSTCFPMSSDYHRTQKNAGFDIRTCWSMTSFIQENKKLIEKSIPDNIEKLCRKESISFVLSAVASSLAFVNNGSDSKLYKCGTKKK
jgi:hypothetical protein